MRQMLLFVLLASVSSFAHGVERQVPPGIAPTPLTSVVTRNFVVPGQKSAPPARATALDASAVIEQFARRERTAAQENRRRAEAEMARLRRAGGLQALWKQQLEELSARMKTAPSDPRLPKISDDLRAKLASFAVCQTPTISRISDFMVDSAQIRVGATFIINGCRFGDTPGTVRLHAPASGIDFTLGTIEWHDDYIFLKVEAPLTGIQNQPSVLQVSTAAGATSDLFDVMVWAQRSTQKVASRPNSNVLNGSCAETTDFDQCVSLFKDPQFQVVDHSLGGIHWSRCCFNGVSGTDRYQLSLKNGWTLLYVGGFDDRSLTTCSSTFGNDPGKVDTPTGFTVGSAATTIEVNWWVDANCSEAMYVLDVVVAGPLGVPIE